MPGGDETLNALNTHWQGPEQSAQAALLEQDGGTRVPSLPKLILLRLLKLLKWPLDWSSLFGKPQGNATPFCNPSAIGSCLLDV